MLFKRVNPSQQENHILLILFRQFGANCYTHIMKYVLMIIGVVCIVVLAVLLERPTFKTPMTEPPAVQTFSEVSIGTTTIPIEVADSQKERMQGLSGRQSLPSQSGMLLIFDYESEWGIWMKDMSFSIDIIWAKSDGEIIAVAHNVAPETYPNAFLPPEPALYVLEVPAGFAKTHSIVEGMHLQVQ